MTPNPKKSCWWKTIVRMPFCSRTCWCGTPRDSSTSAWTSSLRETLEQIERERFDAILLDLSLPDSHGLDTITAALHAPCRRCRFS